MQLNIVTVLFFFFMQLINKRYMRYFIMLSHKTYVEMRVSFGADGIMTPVAIRWNDGRVFEIDRVLDIRRAASEAGGSGTRYTVKIMGKERRLFFEDTYSDTGRARWFVETAVG